MSFEKLRMIARRQCDKLPSRIVRSRAHKRTILFIDGLPAFTLSRQSS
jgi:hypothetical protein